MEDLLMNESDEIKLSVYKLLTNDPFPENYDLRKVQQYLIDIHDIRSIELAIRQVKSNESNKQG